MICTWRGGSWVSWWSWVQGKHMWIGGWLDIWGTEKTMRWSILGENGKDGEREYGLNLDLSCDVGSDSTDEEDNVDDIEKAEEAQLTGWLHNIGGIRNHFGSQLASINNYWKFTTPGDDEAKQWISIIRIRDVRRSELNGIGSLRRTYICGNTIGFSSGFCVVSLQCDPFCELKLQ